MRPIACSPVHLKVLESLVSNSIGSITTRPSDLYRFAYEAKRRTLDVVSCLSNAINVHLDKGCNAFIAVFLGFNNVFSTQPRQGLLDKWATYWLTKWVHGGSLYWSQPNNKLSSVIPNNCGVLQGAVLSSFFFTLHTFYLYSESLASFF